MKRFWSSNLVTLAYQKSTTSSCIDNFHFLVNAARPDGTFLFVVWFIHWRRMILPFLYIDKQKWKLSIHELVVDFWSTKLRLKVVFFGLIKWCDWFKIVVQINVCNSSNPQSFRASDLYDFNVFMQFQYSYNLWNIDISSGSSGADPGFVVRGGVSRRGVWGH
jgi:hypothetical protein